MKQIIRFTTVALVLLSLQSCLTQKLLNESLVGIFGIDKICFSEPMNYTFDPNKPDVIKVQLTLANSNNYDVTGSLAIQILIIDKNGTFIGGTHWTIPQNTVFPKNQANAYISPFIDAVCGTQLKVGEKYTIEARKFVIGATYSASSNPFESSCYLYKYPITLK